METQKSSVRKLLAASSLLAIIAGVILAAGGVWGITFTYKNIARENITTPEDASIPNTPVRGPLTLKAQADIIRTHTLKTTGGKAFAEMPRQIPRVDDNGKSVLDSSGRPVMVANTARDMWITATVLITALNLGVITYAFSALVFLFGLVLVWTGIIFRALSKKY